MGRAWADIIEQLMKEAGISQRQLATRAGVCRSALRRLLADSDGPLSLVEKILRALGYDLDALPRETCEPPDKTPVIELQPPEPLEPTKPPRRPVRLVDHTVKPIVRHGRGELL